MKRDERQEAKRDRAQPVKNSGRGFRKGDARLGRFLVDYKHNSKSFSLSRINWIKMRKDAWRDQYRYPCISVVLGEDSDVKVAIIEWSVFRELIEGSDYE